MGRSKQYDRASLLKTTTQMFWKKGFADTSLADIEKATGVNKSSLYAEFKGKDDIFTASLEDYIKTNGVYQTLEREPFGRENLLEFLKIGKSCAGQRGCFVVNSLRESAILPSRASDIIDKHLKRVRSLLIKNIEATDASINADEFADLILTFNAGLCLEQNAKRGSQDSKIESFLKLLERF